MQTPTNLGESSAVSDGGDKPPLEAVKVDKESARMLHRLRRAWDADGGDGYLTSSELRQATELDDTTSVNYRMDTHLIPGELAAEKRVLSESGAGEQPRRYVIQQRGIEWLEDHPDTPLPPDEQIAQLRADLEQSIEEIEATARTAKGAASSADEAVESLSGQLGGLKSRIGEIVDRLETAEDTLAATHEAASNQATVLEDHADRLDELAAAAADRDDRLDGVESQLTTLRNDLSDTASTLNKNADFVEDRASEVDRRLDELAAAAADRDDRLDAIAERQEEILDRLDTPWWRRIF